MSRLLQAGFLRIRKNHIFIGGLILTFLFPAAVIINHRIETAQYGASSPLDNFLFVGPISISIILAVLCSLFVGTEYSDGTIRNKLVVGHTRTGIYFSHFYCAHLRRRLCTCSRSSLHLPSLCRF